MDKQLNKILDEIIKYENGLALATIVKVDGSAYRKAGTMMLFTKDNQQIGMLTVGCLEDDAQEQVKRMNNENQQSCIMIYDMSSEDDLGWGRGVGCQGKLHVLFEMITEKLMNELKTVQEFLEKGFTVHAYKNLAQVPETVETSYHTNLEATDLEIQTENTYVHSFIPKKRIILFGAGGDVIPLANLAVETGFDVYVWDFREALLTENRLLNVTFIGNWQEFQLRPTDAVIIMTHDFKRDQIILQHLLEREQVLYLGIMGPRKRTRRLLKSSVIPDHLHSPVGMNIGAEGPDEIAVSIMAEVIQVQRSAIVENSCNLPGGRTKQAFRNRG